MLHSWFETTWEACVLAPEVQSVCEWRGERRSLRQRTTSTQNGEFIFTQSDLGLQAHPLGRAI
jgi:hypothetical protein